MVKNVSSTPTSNWTVYKKHLGKHLASYRLGKSNLCGRVLEEAMPIPKQVDSPMSIGPLARHVFSYSDNSTLDLLHILQCLIVVHYVITDINPWNCLLENPIQ